MIFHKMSPHETLFLGETHNVEIQRIANNDFVQFQTWDFGGYTFKIFNLCSMILYDVYVCIMGVLITTEDFPNYFIATLHYVFKVFYTFTHIVSI